MYISKAITGPDILLMMTLNLEQLKYVTNLNHYTDLWNKATTTQYLMSVICSKIQWRTCSIYLYVCDIKKC